MGAAVRAPALRRALQTAWLLGLRTPVVGATMRAVCHLPKNAGRPLPPKDGAEPGAKPRLDIGKPYASQSLWRFRVLRWG